MAWGQVGDSRVGLLSFRAGSVVEMELDRDKHTLQVSERAWACVGVCFGGVGWRKRGGGRDGCGGLWAAVGGVAGWSAWLAWV